jgi:hypothetical protein
VEAGVYARKIAAGERHELNSFGVTGDLVEALAKGRPPIPDDTLYSLLYECRWTCCRCRDPSKSVVIHHIAPWSVTRNHGAENLVLLCNDCHSEAHTSRELAQNFTPEAIRDHKRRWLETVQFTAAMDVASDSHDLCASLLAKKPTNQGNS